MEKPDLAPWHLTAENIPAMADDYRKLLWMWLVETGLCWELITDFWFDSDNVHHVVVQRYVKDDSGRPVHQMQDGNSLPLRAISDIIVAIPPPPRLLGLTFDRLDEWNATNGRLSVTEQLDMRQ